jgi:nucleoside-diphosphate-sugar epimerase
MKSNLSNHRFLITGATGFIGSNLCRYLVSHNCETHILIRKEARLWRIKDLVKQIHVHYSDLSDQQQLAKLLNKIQPTVIYHLAAYGAYPEQTDRNLINQTNYFGTLNLLQASLNIPYELFVNTGSSSEYGFKHKPMSETDLTEPNSDYAVSKVAATLLCAHFAQQEKKPVVTLRPFSVYGPYEEPNRLVPNLMKALYLQKSIDLVSPQTARDFIFIDDVVNLYLAINKLAKNSGKYFNLGTGKQSTIKNMVQLTQQVSRKKLTCNWNNMPARSWDTNNWVANMSQTTELLNWQPKYSLAQGLKKTWKWYLQHHQLYE